MKKSTKRTISIYLKGHLVLMLIVSFLIWFPVFFVLYGGIQATALLYYLKRKTSGEITVPARRVIYLFSLLQIVYTIALLYVGMFSNPLILLQNFCGWHTPSTILSPEGDKGH